MRGILLDLLLVVAVLLGTAGRLGAYLFAMTPGTRASSHVQPVGSTPRYAAPGPHHVGVRYLTANDQPAGHLTVWYPARGAERDVAGVTYSYGLKLFGPPGVTLATYSGMAQPAAPPEPGGAPYPLVLLAPGFAIGSASYAWLAEHLASYGFVVLSNEPAETLDPGLLWQATIDRPREMAQLLGWAAEETDGGVLDGLVDPERVATIGHSYGGYAALAAAGARLDTTGLGRICANARADGDPVVFLCDALEPHVRDMSRRAGLGTTPEALWPGWGDSRIDAVVTLAGDAIPFGQRGAAELSVPVLAIGGTADEDSPYEWGAGLTYDAASGARKIGVGLHGAQHMLFAGRCDAARRLMRLLPEPFCADPAWDRATAQALVKHLATAFLLAELAADPDAASALAPAAVEVPDITYRAEGYR